MTEKRDKHLQNAYNRTAYWKQKAKQKEFSLKLLEVFEADPEMKWFLLWLGAGAVGSIMGPSEPAKQPGEEGYTDQTAADAFGLGDTGSTDAWDIASWLTGPGLLYNLYKSNNPAATMTLPGLVGDLAEGDISGLTMPGLIGKILGNASKANSISAIALAMIIIGRMSQGDGGGMLGKMLAAGV